MANQYLLGPLSKTLADQYLADPQQRGECLVFGENGAFPVNWGDSWTSIADRFSTGWRPDYLVLVLAERIISPGLWDAPVPIIGLAGDWKRRWHHYRLSLRRCDLILTDAEGVATLEKIGLPNARPGWHVDNKQQALAKTGEQGTPAVPQSFPGLPDGHWRELAKLIDSQADILRERVRQRLSQRQAVGLLERTWQQVSAPLANDPMLVSDIDFALQQSPTCSALRHLQGVVFQTANPADNLEIAANAFQSAWTSDPRHLLAGLNLAEILLAMGHKDHAMEQVHRTLAVLERLPGLSAAALEAPHVSQEFRLFGELWERAAWANAGNREAETNDKRNLLRWRLHRILADLTGDLVHHFHSYAARPDLAFSQAGLGRALARDRRPADALPYMQAAYRQNRLDREVAFAYFGVLGQLGLTGDQHVLVRERQALALEMPQGVPVEPWFASPPAAPALLTATSRLRIVWQGAQKALHSLALVNREICARLIESGHELSLIAPTSFEPDHSALILPDILQASFAKDLTGPADVHISHQWPPDFRKPPQGRWVIIQPWEFGSLPKTWIGPLTFQLDEAWVPSVFVRDCYIKSGVPAEKVHVVPNGVSPIFFERQPALPLKTKKGFRFLFVGGTIKRKGIDLLLKAYHQVFSAQDDVCLVIKDMGAASFYQGQTAEALIAQFQQRPHAPEVEYLTNELTAEQMAGLYAACHCLVHPYRGEGFGLPIAEAMACGLPVVVTGLGAALDFCREEHAYLIPAQMARLASKQIGDLETVDFPWWAEPDQDSLRLLLRYVTENRDEARSKGVKAQEFIRSHFTWEHAVAAVQARLAHLTSQQPLPPIVTSTPVRSHSARPTVSLTMIVKNEEKNLPACLDSVADLVDEIIIVDTGSSDATVDVAKSRGAKVFHFPWIDDFAAARNEALRHASGDWIFWMDADDRLDEANRPKLRKLLSDLPSEMVGFVMKCLCLPDPETGTSTMVDHVRLFRNHPELRWKYRIHEQILMSLRRFGGTVRWSDVVIHHVGYQDTAVRGKKLARDMRLLQLEDQEHPDDPFTLFNLGSVYLEQNLPAQAVDVLQRSLQRSHPTDSIVRKTYSLLAQSHRLLGNPEEAKNTCQEGRKIYPQDPEILFQESVVLQILGNKQGAIGCLLQLVDEKDGAYFASVDTGLRGCKGHHNLAVLYQETNQCQDAERHWRLSLQKEHNYLPALVGLGDLYLRQERHEEFREALQAVENHPQGKKHGSLLRGRKLLADKEFSLARATVEQIIEADPEFLPARAILSHILLQEGKDWQGAERALQEVLARDPNNAEAHQNLKVLSANSQIRGQGLPQERLPLAESASAPPNQQPPSERSAFAETTSPGRSTSPRPRVSLAMIVKNEEKNLLACLNCVADLVDEMVIVDTGSSDATVEVAKSRGAKVFHFPWIDSFAAARNEALRHASGDWILWMDADDRLDESNRRKLHNLLADLPSQMVGFMTKYVCLPGPESGAPMVVNRAFLMPNHPKLRWEYRVHEQILIGLRRLGGSIRSTDLVIHHLGLQDAEVRRKKLKRNLHLLHLEDEGNPDDPFVLFYLGNTYLEQKLAGKALDYLQRSLVRSKPTDVFAGKLYSLLAQCHRSLNNLEEARRICQEGRSHFPQNPEILFEESIVLHKLGDKQGAIACLAQLVESKESTSVASIDTGLCGCKGHHNLGVLYAETKQWSMAERHWRLALDKEKDYLPSLLALGEHYVMRSRPKELQGIVNSLERHPQSKNESMLLQARGLLEQKQFGSARSKVNEIIKRDPEFLPARIILSHILLQEGKNWKTAETALREILDRDPNNGDARQNLEALKKLRKKQA